MFFWMVLASLMGIIVFGNLTEKAKNQEDFVVPVYEAMALSTLQQHVAAERGYTTAIQAAPTATNTYQNTPVDGIVPLVTVENGALTKGGNDNNNIFDLETIGIGALFSLILAAIEMVGYGIGLVLADRVADAKDRRSVRG